MFLFFIRIFMRFFSAFSMFLSMRSFLVKVFHNHHFISTSQQPCKKEFVLSNISEKE